MDDIKLANSFEKAEKSMKRNNLFIVKQIAGSKYLLPVGQMIAEQCRGIKINSTSEYIWEQLTEDISFDELISRCISEFEIDDNGAETLISDVKKLLAAFRDRGMIEGSSNKFRCGCSRCRNRLPLPEPEWFEELDGKESNRQRVHFGNFEIGGLPVEMYGDEGFFDKAFESFRIHDQGTYEKMKNKAGAPMNIEIIDVNTIGYPEKNNPTDMYSYYDTQEAEERKSEEIRIETDKSEVTGHGAEEKSKEYNLRLNGDNQKKGGIGKTLLHHNDLTVLEYHSRYVLFLNELDGVEELHLSKDGRYAIVYCDSSVSDVKANLSNAIRMAFLIYGLMNGRVMLHSCSVLLGDKVIAFSGPSGTGKSTHGALWKKIYNVPIINGDLNFIGMEAGVPYVYGTPWCGSSGIYENRKRRLGGIVLLKQKAENIIESLDLELKILLVQQRLITSIWNREMLDKTFKIVEEIVSGLYVKRYFCNKEDDAARKLHDDICKQ